MQNGDLITFDDMKDIHYLNEVKWDKGFSVWKITSLNTNKKVTLYGSDPITNKIRRLTKLEVRNYKIEKLKEKYHE